ncbi:MAG TPA: energy transducer TonB [Chitinophagales bacterium]|nr:energy transducer TonB [Chitinophagales bacterium]
MKKCLPLIVAILFFAACNQTGEQSTEHAVVTDTFTQTALQSFNTAPNAKDYYLKFEPRDKDVPLKQSKAILKLLAAMQAQPQHFSIKPIELNELQGEYGTRISVAPSSFTFKDGREVTSDIDIELKECYTTGEMLEENLTTTMGNKVLETRAAVYVSATCNGERVELKEGEEINIEFPFAVNGNDGYRFYYGTQVQNNTSWIPATGTTSDALAGAAKTQLYKPEFNYKGYTLDNYLLAQLEYPEEAKRNELSGNVEVTFTVDKNGKVRDVNCGSAYKTFREEIITTLEQMPKWKPATYGKRKVSAQVKLNVDFNLRRKDQVIVAFSDNSIIPLVSDKSDVVFTDKVFTQRFDKLGWIACSRITNTQGTKADVIIQDDADCDVRLVVKNKNAIVRGNNCVGYSRFDDLAVDQQVYIVAVRYSQGQMFYAIQGVTLEKQTVVALNWIKGSEDEFEAAVRHMNPSV